MLDDVCIHIVGMGLERSVTIRGRFYTYWRNSRYRKIHFQQEHSDEKGIHAGIWSYRSKSGGSLYIRQIKIGETCYSFKAAVWAV